MKYIYKLQRFMYGRNGPDNLYHFLFKVYLLLLILNIFIHHKVLWYLELVTVVLMFYRFFSKNIKNRRRENDFYLKIKKKVEKPFTTLKRNYKDRNEYKYKRCHKCGTILRLPLPLKIGFKTTKCPNCKRKMKVLVLRRQKQVIIRKGESI